jgi:hypothetical protein
LFSLPKLDGGVSNIRVSNLKPKWENKIPDAWKDRIGIYQLLKKLMCNTKSAVRVFSRYTQDLTHVWLSLEHVSLGSSMSQKCQLTAEYTSSAISLIDLG